MLPRTAARALILLAAALVAAPASAHPPKEIGPYPAPKPAPKAKPKPPAAGPRIIFPVVGPVTYSDDWGAPRGSRRHEGNDLMAPKRSVAVAAESGTVTLWTTSARAGCMLYLKGASGTTYLYIHLNNDLTAGNDNTGKCVPGVAYAPGLKSGAKVAAGQPVGFVGDSGDANGGGAHLHFEAHPGGGKAVDPYPLLQRARKLLFAVPPGKPFTAALRGTVVGAADGALTMKVQQVRAWPGGVKVPKVDRKVRLAVPPETVVTNPLGSFVESASLASLEAGTAAVAWTAKAKATLQAQLGAPLALATAKLVLTTTP